MIKQEERQTYSKSQRLELVISSLEQMSDVDLLKYEERLDRLYAQYLEATINGSLGRRVVRLYEHLIFVQHLQHNEPVLISKEEVV
jgi:hypothetical protein